MSDQPTTPNTPPQPSAEAKPHRHRHKERVRVRLPATNDGKPAPLWKRVAKKVRRNWRSIILTVAFAIGLVIIWYLLNRRSTPLQPYFDYE